MVRVATVHRACGRVSLPKPLFFAEDGFGSDCARKHYKPEHGSFTLKREVEFCVPDFGLLFHCCPLYLRVDVAFAPKDDFGADDGVALAALL